MKKLIYLLIVSFGLNLEIMAQYAGVPHEVRVYNTLERLTSGDLGKQVGATIPGIPRRQAELIGDTYYNDHWNQSVVMLYESEKLLEGFLIRYDAYLNEIDVLVSGGMRVVNGKNVRSFVMFDSVTQKPQYFINAKDFKDKEGVPLIGFFEVLLEGKMPLMKKMTISIRQPDFNPALNVGKQDYIIYKYRKFYFLKDEMITEIKKPKKNLDKIFPDKLDLVTAYVKENKLDLENEDHLISLFSFYNGLFKE